MDRQLTIYELEGLDELGAASRLIERIWERIDLAPVDLLRALSHAGNYVAGAFADGRLVGVLFGFRSAHGLHSHVLGVEPRARGLGVGFQLKQHQREWALARAIDLVTWTFDPLIARNAYFNLCKLGAEAGAYQADFYGPGQDRLVVTWRLRDERVVRASRGCADVVDLDQLDEASVRRYPVPADQAAARATLGQAMAAGWRATGFVRSGVYVLTR